ncbi:MAG TPA: phage holin family protein [Candidatus Eisenbacteria bacterium]|nr:phage holin family protein [Candidatus Eisenbacteria bacterium]
MRVILHLILNTLAVAVAAYVLPGVFVDGPLTALVVAVVLGVVNVVVKPILVLLTLPITVVTLGLFLFVINALIILLVDWLVPGFEVDGFWWALLFSLVVSLVGSFLNAVANE